MMRYFFDVKAQTSVEHDYSGRDLPSLEQAEQMAELIAMDLGCTRLDGSSGLEVQIRNAAGTLLASLPVKLVDVLAA
jgi:hypothetical protein